MLDLKNASPRYPELELLSFLFGTSIGVPDRLASWNNILPVQRGRVTGLSSGGYYVETFCRYSVLVGM